MKRDPLSPDLAGDHPDNAGVLAYLTSRGHGAPAIAPASSHPDPYRGAGSHPDIVDQVWTKLGAMHADSHVLVHGSPALVQPRSGVVLAVALGTTYALRIPPSALADAESLGFETRHRYGSAGVELDLATFGATWRFGRFHDSEPGWVAEEAERLTHP